ncbi:MAG: HD domain-containing protein [Eubacterium sp.]
MLNEKDKGRFSKMGTFTRTEKWEAATQRKHALYQKEGDIRTPFGRDFTRILHSTAYRRLKHKTQVFFSPGNDHISTRIEHVNYVESIASTISEFLGLNVELARAISIGHDLGHPPFGHHGEFVLNTIVRDEGLWSGMDNHFYWHEKNGLHFVDNIELLEGPDRKRYNLDLTYGVRDGIIAHCGEVHDPYLFPREEAMDLSEFKTVNAHAPFTWEGCVVKLADKISYLGRDIEDAQTLDILTKTQLKTLDGIVADYLKKQGSTDGNVNNTTVIHLLILDLCENSTPDSGLRFSDEGFAALKSIQDFNIKNIYHHDRLNGYKDYGELIIHRVYNALKELYNKGDIEEKIPYFKKQFPLLTSSFMNWVSDYWNRFDRTAPDCNLKNKIIYHVPEAPKDFQRAIIDYISGMTDHFIEKVYQELIRF